MSPMIQVELTDARGNKTGPKWVDTGQTDADGYVKYYGSQGIGVHVLNAGQNAPPTDAQQLQSYGMGNGPAPAGLQHGYQLSATGGPLKRDVQMAGDRPPGGTATGTPNGGQVWTPPWNPNGGTDDPRWTGLLQRLQALRGGPILRRDPPTGGPDPGPVQGGPVTTGTPSGGPPPWNPSGPGGVGPTGGPDPGPIRSERPITTGDPGQVWTPPWNPNSAPPPDDPVRSVNAYTTTGGDNPQPAGVAQGDAPPGGTATGTPSRPLTVKMPDGSTQQFTGQYWGDPKLDAALKAGGQPLDPLDPSGQKTMKVTPGVYGGYLFDGLPINTVATGEFAPGQKEVLNNYYAAGYTSGGPALTNPPALPPSAAQYYPNNDGTDGSGSPFDFGYLAKTFDEKFKAPGGAPGAFQAPDGQPGPFVQPTTDDLNNDPGVQYRLEQAQKATGRIASAGQYLNAPRAALEMNRNIQGVAGSEYDAAFQRKLAGHNTQEADWQNAFASGLAGHNSAVNDYQNSWDRQMQEYQQRYNVDTGNKTRLFNEFSTVAGGGQIAANQIGTTGQNTANQIGINNQNAATAAGNAALIAAQAKRQAAGNIAAGLPYGLSTV